MIVRAMTAWPFSFQWKSPLMNCSRITVSGSRSSSRNAGKQSMTFRSCLAAHLRQLGYPAVHLDRKGKMVDAGFQMKML